MKLWIDDLRPAPPGYTWIKTTNMAIDALFFCSDVELIDLDHDAGDYVKDGGDYIEILNWMEKEGINWVPIHLHTMNPVGRQNMRAIIEKNNWREIF